MNLALLIFTSAALLYSAYAIISSRKALQMANIKFGRLWRLTCYILLSLQTLLNLAGWLTEIPLHTLLNNFLVSAITLYLCARTFQTFGTLTEHGLRMHLPWLAAKQGQWIMLQEVSIPKPRTHYRLSFKDGTVINLHRQLEGLNPLLRTISERASDLPPQSRKVLFKA